MAVFVFWEEDNRLETSSPRSDASLTYAVAQDDGQHHGYADGDQGGALPGAVFGWLLELESPSGQAVSGQRARRCGVDRPRCHGVTRGRCAKERCRSCARFKKKVPAKRGNKNKEWGEDERWNERRLETAPQNLNVWGWNFCQVSKKLCSRTTHQATGNWERITISINLMRKFWIIYTFGKAQTQW